MQPLAVRENKQGAHGGGVNAGRADKVPANTTLKVFMCFFVFFVLKSGSTPDTSTLIVKI